jgi:hypothetical protein
MEQHPMRNFLAPAGLCLGLLGAAAAAGPAVGQGAAAGPGMDRLEPGQLLPEQIRIVLGARGYSELGRMEREGDTVLIPEAKRYGEATGPLRLDAKTGQVLDEKPLSEAQAQALLRDRGYSEVREARREGDIIVASAQRGGSRMDVKVDARSGTVSQR